jgi:hypothetical protein
VNFQFPKPLSRDDTEHGEDYYTSPQMRAAFDAGVAESKAQILELKKVVAVAITQLYGTDKEDVLAEFSIGELQAISDISESMRKERVEHIYKAAWDFLAANN